MYFLNSAELSKNVLALAALVRVEDAGEVGLVLLAEAEEVVGFEGALWDLGAAGGAHDVAGAGGGRGGREQH